AFTLEVVEILGSLPDSSSYDDVVQAASSAQEAEVRRAVNRLRGLALVWGDDEALHLIRAVRELLPPSDDVGDMHPVAPAVAAIPVDADRSAHTAAAHALDAVRAVDDLLQL